MNELPIHFKWDGESMIPIHPKRADREYVVGETYCLAPYADRSAASHNHQFAWIHDAFMNLPEHLALEYASPEHLRKRALIEAGYYDEQAIEVGSLAARCSCRQSDPGARGIFLGLCSQDVRHHSDAKEPIPPSHGSKSLSRKQDGNPRNHRPNDRRLACAAFERSGESGMTNHKRVAPTDDPDLALVKGIAMDIGKSVVAYVERQYPQAISATSSTFKLALRNTVYNEIIAALKTTDRDEIFARLNRRKKERRELKALWSNIRDTDWERFRAKQAMKSK